MKPFSEGTSPLQDDNPPPVGQPLPPLHRGCPVCDANDASPHWRKGDLRLVQCRRCSMIYADPVDPALASGAFYDRRGESYYLFPEKLESDYAPVRFERELRLFRQFCPGGEVLDVGCSTGGFLFQLTNSGGPYAVTGLDVAGAALDHAESRGLAVIREPFLEHDFGPRRFGAITFWAVLEHLARPKPFLEKAAALVRPGGFCFVLVPNLRSLAVRLLGPKYRYVVPEHLNYFTPATLRALAAAVASLEVVAVRSTHFNPLVIWQDWRRGGSPVPDEARARLLRRTTTLKQSPWAGPLKLVYTGVEKTLGALTLADNLVMVLRKKRAE